MEAPCETDDADLGLATHFDAMGAAQLDGALGGFAAGAEQEDLLQSLGRNRSDDLGCFGAFFAGEDVVVNEAAVDLVDHRLADFWRGVAGIRHQHTAAPVEPLVAVFVEDVDVQRLVPNDGRHATHGLGLKVAQLLQRGDGVGVRQWRADAAMLGFDVWNRLWCDAEFFAHGKMMHAPAFGCYSLCSKSRYFCALKDSRRCAPAANSPGGLLASRHRLRSIHAAYRSDHR